MNSELIRELVKISQTTGIRPDYVQGGGGNTSVKSDNNLMAVKASGYRLKDITEHDGFVYVDYKKIKEYHEKVDITDGGDYEKESGKVIKENTIQADDLKTLRPSVEAGFHSILMKYVIHTHSVYANIVCCCSEGRSLADEILKEEKYGHIWIPYVNPGFSLVLAMNKEIAEYKKTYGHSPQVVFMENHGLVVTADTADSCLELHERVNEKIKNYLEITDPFPEVIIEAAGDEGFRSKTDYLSDYFKGKDITNKFFDDTVLYPDQLVYLNDSVSVNNTEGKLNINTETGEILYKTSEKEALTMEETLFAYIYVVENIRAHNLTLKTMNSSGTDFIKSWESEKYRKKLAR